jgi:hypothetical protein
MQIADGQDGRVGGLAGVGGNSVNTKKPPNHKQTA